MKLLKVDTLDMAREKLLERLGSRHLETEVISLDEISSGTKILAKDILSPCNIPGFRRSIVDGYALTASDTQGAGDAIPVFLKQKGTVHMGKPAGFSIGSGECAYVPTGGILPAGADAVVMIEYTEKVYSPAGDVAVYEAAAPGTGIAEADEDVGRGDLILCRGTLLRPQEAGVLAGAGITSIPVFAPLKLAIISSGDELVPPEREPCPGEIRDINTYALKALAVKRGYQVISAQVLGDNQEQLEGAMRNSLASSDIVVISGGSSQGEKDMSRLVIDRVANPGVFTHGLALKPGKPTILGWDEKNSTLLIGLPGHPVAAMIVFELLLGWLSDRLFSRPAPFAVPARLSTNVPGAPGRTVCQPVILSFRDEIYSAEPVFGKSGMITTLTRANGYIIIDLNKEGLNKGEPVLVHPL